MADDGASAAVATEVSLIEEALDTLLTACTDHAAKPRRGTGGVGGYSMAELMADFEKRLTMTKAERRVADLIKDPVASVLRLGIRRIGERLFEIGGLGLMQDVLDRVANLDGAKWGHRTSICDNRWDGIGRTATRAGWSA